MSSSRSKKSEITSTYPGKIILSGEHIVIYGYPAVLKPIDQTTNCSISISQSLGVRVKTNLEEYTITSIEVGDNQSLTALSVVRVLEHLSIRTVPNLLIEITSDVPIGGFGSSTALSASIVDSVSKVTGHMLSHSQLIELTTSIEHEYFGYVSGADPYVIINKSPVRFRRSKDGDIDADTIKLESRSLSKFLVINSGRPTSSTGECVKHVAKLKELKPKRTERIFSSLNNLQTTILDSLRQDNIDDLLLSIRESGDRLVELGIVRASTQKLVSNLANLGGYSKISGAGSISGDGSGALLCFSKNYKPIEIFLKSNNWQYFEVGI